MGLTYADNIDIMGDMKATQESKTMNIFEATARNIMRQRGITTRKALVSAMREFGYARHAADRTADKIFGKPEPMQWKHYD